MARDEVAAPQGAATSRVRHQVPFYETDAMGVVHHSNFVRYLEIARIQWLTEHDQPYERYVELGMHFATTHVEVDYLGPIRFADVVEIETWTEWVRGASLRIEYILRVEGAVVATAATEHAAIDTEGRVRRIPKDHREALRATTPQR